MVSGTTGTEKVKISKEELETQKLIVSLKSDLKDITQLYSHQGKELNKVEKERNDYMGDIKIKNEILKENSALIAKLDRACGVYELEAIFANKMEATLRGIINQLINR